jgi:cation diffusion facilitator family transporter
MQEGNRRAIVAALCANLGLAVAKFVAFSFTGAASMLAESVHSVADTGNQALLLWGGARARRAPTPEHPFGYGRERYFWAFVVSLVIFSLGSLFALYQGLTRFQHPHELTSPGWAVGVLLTGILLEGGSLALAVRESNAIRGDSSWWEFIRRSKNPELPVVLLEDLGALAGLVIALLGIALAVITGNPIFDAVGSIAIGGLLGVIAVVLAIEMQSLLIGEAASNLVQDLIRQRIHAVDGVERLIHMRTQHLGPDSLLVGAKIEFDRSLDVAALAAAIDRVEAGIRAGLELDAIIYIEPDIYSASRSSDPAAPDPPAG